MIACRLCVPLAAPDDSARSDDQEAKPQQYSMDAYWVHVTEKHGDSKEHRVTQAPNLRFFAEKGRVHRNSNVQGKIDDPMHYGAVSMGSVTMRGGAFPLEVGLEYTFKDNTGEDLRLKRRVTLDHEQGQLAMSTADSKAVLLLFWKPSEKPKRDSSLLQGSPHQIGLEPLEEVVLYGPGGEFVLSRIVEREGLFAVKRLLRGFSIPQTSGLRLGDPQLLLTLRARNKLKYKIHLASRSVFSGLAGGPGLPYPLRGGEVIQAILAKFGHSIIKNEKLLGGTFSVYQSLRDADGGGSSSVHLLFFVGSEGQFYWAQCEVQDPWHFEIVSDEERRRLWLQDKDTGRVLAYFDDTQSQATGSGDDAAAWTKPPIAHRFGEYRSKDATVESPTNDAPGT